MAETLFFLDNCRIRLLLFGGKGGVGKTTCASAAALHMARSQASGSFLLVSTDPAHSLADCLTNTPLPNNLTTLELDAQVYLENFKTSNNDKLREIASRGTFLDDEDISRFMDLSLPGLDELMAFLEISEWVVEQRYDCIIMDTAPTGHTLRLLTMPDFIRRWIDALDVLLAKHRYMKKLFSAGEYRRDFLDEFLLELSDSVDIMKDLLTDPAWCRFIPVMLSETPSIHETVSLMEKLRQLKIPISDVIVNRLFPESSCPVCTDRSMRQAIELNKFLTTFPGYVVWGIPIYPQEACGRNALDRFWDGIFALACPKDPLTITNAWPPQDLPSTGKQNEAVGKRLKIETEYLQHTSDPVVKQPAQFPFSKIKLMLFAGKGGVGKTTVACATAIRMSKEFSSEKIFLFSTDPAHSLSTCLDIQIGSYPTSVATGLTAMEIDAQAEFESLKEEYADELEDFLNNLSPNLDLTFDREVMERIMDLSPPGIDEVMALTRAMEFLVQGKYDVLILDSAPTGHLIRLLETPELIDQWLKVFFNLFLKYKRIFRLPKISNRMVELSKNLKFLRSLLKNPDESALYAVTILTEMAFLETEDLSIACKEMGIHMPVLFLNLATPQGPCHLCSEIYNREAKIIEKLKCTFPGKHQTLIYQQGKPLGIEKLGKLGAIIFK